MSARHVFAAVLAAAALLLIPTAVGATIGVRTGDALCTETGDSIPDLSCLAPVAGGFLIGGLIGLAIGATLAVWTVRRLRDRWRGD